jgi:hypothetical protein
VTKKLHGESADEGYRIPLSVNFALNFFVGFHESIRLPYYRKLTMHFINADFKNSR